MPRLHGNLGLDVAVLCLQLGVFDDKVVGLRSAGKPALFVLARPVHAIEGPVGHGDGEAEEDDEEDVEPGEQPDMDERDDFADKAWSQDDGGDELDIGEATVACCSRRRRQSAKARRARLRSPTFSWQRSVCDGRHLGEPDAWIRHGGQDVVCRLVAGAK